MFSNRGGIVARQDTTRPSWTTEVKSSSLQASVSSPNEPGPVWDLSRYWPGPRQPHTSRRSESTGDPIEGIGARPCLRPRATRPTLPTKVSHNCHGRAGGRTVMQSGKNMTQKGTPLSGVPAGTDCYRGWKVRWFGLQSGRLKCRHPPVLKHFLNRRTTTRFRARKVDTLQRSNPRGWCLMFRFSPCAPVSVTISLSSHLRRGPNAAKMSHFIRRHERVLISADSGSKLSFLFTHPAHGSKSLLLIPPRLLRSPIPGRTLPLSLMPPDTPS